MSNGSATSPGPRGRGPGGGSASPGATYDVVGWAIVRLERGRVMVHWKGARYSGVARAIHRKLDGRVVVVQASSLDVRRIALSLQCEGTPIGTLEVEPRWRHPHTLTARLATIRSRRRAVFASIEGPSLDGDAAPPECR